MEERELEVGGRGGAWRLTLPLSTSTLSLQLQHPLSTSTLSLQLVSRFRRFSGVFARIGEKVREISETPLRGARRKWYTTHSFARKGRTSILENRELEDKENYNSYTRSDGASIRSEAKVSC